MKEDTEKKQLNCDSIWNAFHGLKWGWTRMYNLSGIDNLTNCNTDKRDHIILSKYSTELWEK
jgi:hypothetical protein